MLSFAQIWRKHVPEPMQSAAPPRLPATAAGDVEERVTPDANQNFVNGLYQTYSTAPPTPIRRDSSRGLTTDR